MRGGIFRIDCIPGLGYPLETVGLGIALTCGGSFPDIISDVRRDWTRVLVLQRCRFYAWPCTLARRT